ncbi:hypothetical protein AAG570_000519 [Ranatra chinensis]|uniref:C-type lectin domain-containing protein n=1 Tax=Ranatra chinensis TaxID=642074 RepID=A0ABD0YXB5_9HEMI
MVLETVNATQPEFPDLSPWIPTLFTDEIRDDKIIKSPNVLASTKIVVNNKKPVGSNLQNNEITQTDMYLLTAIEKLTYRLESVEKRLRRTEELIFHIMEGSHINRHDACPGNFTRVARNCYHFGERQLNWKSAASLCKGLGANLLEMESPDEFMEVVTFVQANGYLRGYDFWTGGLNPGLLWIWSNSARPVLPKGSGGGRRPYEIVYGTGRCLKLAINNNKLYEYRGTDCAARQRYICEHEENAVIRALDRIQKSLTIKEKD